MVIRDRRGGSGTPSTTCVAGGSPITTARAAGAASGTSRTPAASTPDASATSSLSMPLPPVAVGPGRPSGTRRAPASTIAIWCITGDGDDHPTPTGSRSIDRAPSPANRPVASTPGAGARLRAGPEVPWIARACSHHTPPSNRSRDSCSGAGCWSRGKGKTSRSLCPEPSAPSIS